MGFWTRMWYYLQCIVCGLAGRTPPELPPTKETLALPPPLADLSNLTVAVFVREPNCSRTNIEHYLEQELINRGARVVMANQKAGLELMKTGNFEQLAVGSNFSLVGTLTTSNNLVLPQTCWVETEFAFNERRAKFEQVYEDWAKYLFLGLSKPKPVLEPRRRKIVDKPAKKLQLNFRIIGSDGAILASGTTEHVIVANEAMPERILGEMAIKAVKYLDENDVWKNVVIS